MSRLFNSIPPERALRFQTERPLDVLCDKLTVIEEKLVNMSHANPKNEAYADRAERVKTLIGEIHRFIEGQSKEEAAFQEFFATGAAHS